MISTLPTVVNISSTSSSLSLTASFSAPMPNQVFSFGVSLCMTPGMNNSDEHSTTHAIVLSAPTIFDIRSAVIAF